MGMSDFPLGPTVRRVAAYLSAIVRHALAAPIDIAAIHILPDSSWSATVKNLLRLPSIVVVKAPSFDTSEYLHKSKVKGNLIM